MAIGTSTEDDVTREGGTMPMVAGLIVLLLAGAPVEDGEASTNHDVLAGAWEVVYGQYGLPDAPVELSQPDKPVQLKLFTSGRFAYVRHSVDGSFQAASAGSYSVTGDRYTETTDWSSVPAAIGTRVTFAFRVVGDTVCMKGPLEVLDGQGKKLQGFKQMKEVMRRVGSAAAGPSACEEQAPAAPQRD
jgi:hypothetical protein